MNSYGRLLGSMGYPIDFAQAGAELGRAMSNFQETKRKSIYEACKNYVVKLVCTNECGAEIGFFKGFMYCDQKPFILTSGHIVGFNNAKEYHALFFQGTSMERKCKMELLHTGTFVRDTTTPAGVPVKVYRPDVALFKCDELPPHPPRPCAAQASVGDTVFIVGFKGTDEPQLSLSEGVVSYHGMDDMHVTAHADDGYSGSPVLSSHGFVLGMVKGGLGSTIKQVEVVSAKTIHDWLGAGGYPGFAS